VNTIKNTKTTTTQRAICTLQLSTVHVFLYHFSECNSTSPLKFLHLNEDKEGISNGCHLLLATCYVMCFTDFLTGFAFSLKTISIICFRKQRRKTFCFDVERVLKLVFMFWLFFIHLVFFLTIFSLPFVVTFHWVVL